MVEKKLMVDIETIGTDYRLNDARILQVSALELIYKESTGFWHPGRDINIYISCQESPTNDFQTKYQEQLFKICNQVAEGSNLLPYSYIVPEKSRVLFAANYEEARQQLLSWLEECKFELPVKLVGQNAGTFDLPWLNYFGILMKLERDKDNNSIGEAHYRVYDLNSVVEFTADVEQLDRTDVQRIAEIYGKKSCKFPEIEQTREQIETYGEMNFDSHNSLFDCYKQLQILNGLIRMA